jgi:hypothetical protein
MSRPKNLVILGAAGGLAAAIVLNQTWPAWWPLALVAGALALMVGWRWGRGVRLVPCLIGAGCIWLGLAWWQGPTLPLMGILVLGVVGAVVFKNLRGRARRRLDLAGLVQEWGELTKEKELAPFSGSRLEVVEDKKEAGFLLKVHLKGSRTLSQAVACQESLESALDQVMHAITCKSSFLSQPERMHQISFRSLQCQVGMEVAAPNTQVPIKVARHLGAKRY